MTYRDAHSFNMAIGWGGQTFAIDQGAYRPKGEKAVATWNPK